MIHVHYVSKNWTPTITTPCPGKRNRQFFGHNFDKFTYIAVIFCKEYRESNAKLLTQHNKSPPHLISVATLPFELDNDHVLQSTKS